MISNQLEDRRLQQADQSHRRQNNPMTAGHRASVEKQKLALLRESFKPVPFPLKKALDFSAHEDLLRALNLWEFVNLDLSSGIRADLLILLIANYDRDQSRSFVGNAELSVGSFDLARALKIPTEATEEREALRGVFSKDVSIRAIEAFMSSYILLVDEENDDDDMCILPPEIVFVTEIVRQGRANEVDWAGLVWTLVERELSEVQRSGSGTCRYAPYLQCMMKFQCPGLFEKDAGEVAAMVADTDSSMDIADDDGVFDCLRKMESWEGYQDVRGSCETGLGSGLGMFEIGGLMDGTESFEDWVDKRKDEAIEHCLRKCGSTEPRGTELENSCKGKQVESEEEEEFPNLETSAYGLRAMPLVNSLDLSRREFVSMEVDRNVNAWVDTGAGGSSGRRQIDEDDFGQLCQNNQPKRMRLGGLSEEQATPCTEVMERTMGKADMLLAQKEQELLDSHFQLQCMSEALEKKDQMIRTLEKTSLEERQRLIQKEQELIDSCSEIERFNKMLEMKDKMIGTLEKDKVEQQQKQERLVQWYQHELNTVSSMMFSYKNALKETQKNFDEYRRKFPQGDEPLYRDVGGAGGLVLTRRELERLRLEEKEDMGRTVQGLINAFHRDWSVKLKDYKEKVVVWNRKLVELEGNVKLIKERFCGM